MQDVDINYNSGYELSGPTKRQCVAHLLSKVGFSKLAANALICSERALDIDIEILKIVANHNHDIREELNYWLL